MVTFEHDQILKRVSTNAIWPTVKEGGRTPPPFPSVFYKANTTVNDHGAPVVIPKICQDEQADYEGELVKHISSVLFFPLLFIICREIPLALEESSTEHVTLTLPSSASSLGKTPKTCQRVRPSTTLLHTLVGTTYPRGSCRGTPHSQVGSLNGASPRGSTLSAL